VAIGVALLAAAAVLLFAGAKPVAEHATAAAGVTAVAVGARLAEAESGC
jgi:hypothetical protein